MSRNDRPLLEVMGLSKKFGSGCSHCMEDSHHSEDARCSHCGTIWACRDISFDLYPGEILGVVGESGSGKSTMVKCLYYDEEITTGQMTLSAYKDGQTNLFTESAQKKRYIRNHIMGMVSQNPYLGLKMALSSPGNIAEKLIAADDSHEGMIQRVQISKAIANNPPLLLLDEVTTGLDLSVQAKVIELIRSIQRELQVAMIVVSHDLDVIRRLSDRTMVLRQGRIVEHGLTDRNCHEVRRI